MNAYLQIVVVTVVDIIHTTYNLYRHSLAHTHMTPSMIIGYSAQRHEIH